jgi:Kef-type K+ transport system membrane component KefB
MNELASLGMILLLALLAGHLVKFIRVPEVTGYIFAGVAVGPFGFNWVTHDNLSTLKVFSEVALGLILLSIGSVFEFTRFRAVGRRIFTITAIESGMAAAAVTTLMLLAGQPWQISVLLGVIAMETAAATTLMVLRECNASGPLTETLTGLIAINNLFCLIGFMLVAALMEIGPVLKGGLDATAIYQSIYPLVWPLVGSVALGYLVGVLLSTWALKVVEHGEMLILLSGCVLLTVGAALALEVSPMIASLALGATLVNLSRKTQPLFDALSRTDPPLYAIFFVIAGADLDLSLLTKIGLLGGLYVAGRSVAKIVGTRLGTRRTGTEPGVKKYLPLAVLSQAGLAVGLILTISRRFPELAPTITTIVLSAVVVFEIIGPISTRFALVRSGETHPEDREPAVLLDQV